MNTVLKHRRGLEAALPTLAEAELWFSKDTYKLFIGSAGGNKGVAMLASPVFTGDIILGATFGDDLVINGGFTGNADGWTLGSFTYGSNAVAHANGGGIVPLSQVILLTANTWYEIQITVTGQSAGSYYVTVGGRAGPNVYTAGTWTWTLFNRAGNSITIVPTDNLIATFDDISLKPLASGDITIGKKLTALEMVLNSWKIDIQDPKLNVGVGMSNMTYLTTGYENIAVGAQALHGNSSGYENVALGFSAMIMNSIGHQNTAIGNGALFLSEGNYNTAIGEQALSNLSSGDSSVAIGRKAGYYETGSNKLFIDNAQRASEADARIKALLYGVFDALTANQRLSINARLLVRECPNYANNAAALAGGLTSGELYTVTGTDPLQVAKVI